jgi:hypothetical protein
MEERVSVFRTVTVTLVLAIAACSSPHDKQVSITPMRAAAPPAGYTHIGSADTSDGKNLQVGVNTDLLGGDKGDEMLSVWFGLYFSGAVGDAKAADMGTTGEGLSVKDPIVFSPAVEAATELQNALNLVAHRAPDRHNIVGSLYRSPDRRYVLLVEFDTAAGANALYFDITNWAKHRIES